MQVKYRPSIWFNGNAMEAAGYYTDLFPETRIGEITRYPDAQPDFNSHMVGEVQTVTVWFGDQDYTFLNAGPEFPHTENFSIEVICENQAEVDKYWDRLVGDGGEERVCGWCKDKFGVNWQIIPRRFFELLADPETEKSVTRAFYGMKKFVVSDLEAAAAS